MFNSFNYSFGNNNTYYSWGSRRKRITGIKIERSEVMRLAHKKLKHGRFHSFSHALRAAWSDMKYKLFKAEEEAWREITDLRSKYDVDPTPNYWMAKAEESGADTSWWNASGS